MERLTASASRAVLAANSAATASQNQELRRLQQQRRRRRHRGSCRLRSLQQQRRLRLFQGPDDAGAAEALSAELLLERGEPCAAGDVAAAVQDRKQEHQAPEPSLTPAKLSPTRPKKRTTSPRRTTPPATTTASRTTRESGPSCLAHFGIPSHTPGASPGHNVRLPRERRASLHICV